MLKELVEYIAKIQTPQRPVTVEALGQTYAVRVDGTLGEVVELKDTRPTRSALVVSTLSGLVAAAKANVYGAKDGVAFRVRSPFDVSLESLTLDEFNGATVFARAVFDEKPIFEFGKFYDPEDFIIALISGFVRTDNVESVLRLVSQVGAGSFVGVTDDGISQEVTVKSGTVTKASVPLPSDGIPLIPWRTFRDANPVEHKFLLRMKGRKEALPQIALFEIDPTWKIATMQSVVKYLVQNAPDAVIIA